MVAFAAQINPQLVTLRTTLMSVITNSSVVTKSAIVSVICCYFLAIISSVRARLLLTTAGLIPPDFAVWTLVTAALTEVSMFKVIIDIVVLLAAGKLIEPSWGALEFLKFLIAMNASVTGLTAVTYMIAYMISRKTNFLYTSFGGLIGTVVAFSIAFKQLYGDIKVVALMNFSYKIKHIPVSLVSVIAVLTMVKVLNTADICMACYGFVVGWVYLRFFQKKNNGSYGDLSDNFSFVSFFPELIQYPIERIANATFLILVSLRICSKQARRYNVGGPSSVKLNMPENEPADAERRRQLALKELSKRLSDVDQPNSWPSLDEVGTSDSNLEDKNVNDSSQTINTVQLTDVAEDETDLV